jgi:hypothetical protein
MSYSSRACLVKMTRTTGGGGLLCKFSNFGVRTKTAQGRKAQYYKIWQRFEQGGLVF